MDTVIGVWGAVADDVLMTICVLGCDEDDDDPFIVPVDCWDPDNEFCWGGGIGVTCGDADIEGEFDV